MAWRSFSGFVSIFSLAVLAGSGCTGGDDQAEFAPVDGSSGVGAGDAPNGGSKASAGSHSGASANSGGSGNGGNNSGATSNSGGADGGGTDSGGTDSGGTDSGGANSGGTDTGGTDTGGTNSGGTDTGGTDSGGTDSGGTAGSTAGGGAGGKGGSGGSSTGPECTTAMFGGHNYSFCGPVDSGNAAFELCEKLGMAVVSIESKAENDFLVGKLAGSSWIGGSDEGHEGVWHWPNEVEFWDQTGDNKGPIQGRYQNWQEGQPNNDNDDGLDENCAVIQMSTVGKGTWNDLACGMDTNFRVTCESTGPVIGPIPL